MKLQHVFFSHFIITTTFNNNLNQTPILIQLIATKNAFLKLTFFQNTIVKNITIQNTHLIKKKKKEHVTTSQIKQSMEFLTWFKRFRGKRIMPRNLKLGENRRKTIKIN
jgi:hypothetical protein